MSYSYEQNKKNIQVRLNRIEGQVRGIQKMIDDNKYCVDVLTQISSIIAATQKVGTIVLEDHINGCLTDAIKKSNGKEKISEVIEVINRFVRV